MSDREVLAAALDDEERIADPDFDDYTIEVNSGNFNLIHTAARKHLAQLPEKCDQPSHPIYPPCYVCGSTGEPGKAYPAELVERIAKAIADAGGAKFVPYTVAVTVLDALNRETP